MGCHTPDFARPNKFDQSGLRPHDRAVSRITWGLEVLEADVGSSDGYRDNDVR